MSEASYLSTSKVDPLTGNNYQVWALKLSAILRSKKLFKVVIEGPEPKIAHNGDKSEENKLRAEWEEKNDEAFAILISTLSNEQAGIFIGETNAKRVWDELKKIYAGQTEDRIIDIGLELKDIHMGYNELVDAYINRARNISARGAALGHKFSEREIVYHVVRGIHNKYEKVGTVLRSQRSTSLDEVQQILREEELRLIPKNGHGRFSQETDRVYKVRNKLQFNQEKTNIKRCYICGKSNHIAENCWQRKGENVGNKHFQKHDNFSTSNRRNNFQSKNNRNSQTNNTENKKSHQSFTTSFNTWHHNKENMENDKWVLDSGCTTHMTPKRDWMRNVEPLQGEVLLAEEDRVIETKAKGCINITTRASGVEQNIIIKNALHVPKLRTNLLSIYELTEKGNTVLFNKFGAEIYSPENELIAEATKENRMFIMESREQNFIEEMANVLENNSDESKKSEKRKNLELENNILWHRRLGHLNEDYIRKLAIHDMVKGLEFHPTQIKICEPCIMGKLCQQPFKSIDQITTTKPLELVCYDLCGPMGKQSLGGAKYILTIVDSYSRRVFTYFISSKDQALNFFVNFKNRYENERNLKINRVRSDNGGEFVNSDFDLFLKKEGIHHELTVPYSPQSNGIAERMNRNLLEKAKTMLIDSELPLEFWAEAVATAAYLINCSPCKKNEQKTPLEKWSGKIPSVNHIKIFGCMAYFFIPKARRGKLDPHAQKGIFVGYSSNRKAYRIFNPRTKRIEEVRTVKFDEERKGAELLNRNNDKDNYDNLKYVNQETESILDDLLEQNDDDNDSSHDTAENEILDETNDAIQEEDLINEEIDEPIQEASDETSKKNMTTQKSIENNHREKLKEREEKHESQGVRRSERLKAKNQALTTAEEKIPENRDQALKSNFKEEWVAAMGDEINSLNLHQVWTLVPRKEKMKILKNKWVFNIKYNPDGSVDRRKARLVAIGSNQKYGTDYFESFSPVIKLESLRLLISIAAKFKMKMKQYDIKTAYLYGNLDETIYMQQPDGFAEEGDTRVCKLQKSLYGLPQSGRCWNKKLNEVLTQYGMIRLESDPCIYKFKKGEEIIFIGAYVDDLIVIGSDCKIIETIMKKIKGHFILSEADKCENFLGIAISETKEGITLSQRNYVDKILKRFGLEECNVVHTPGTPQQDLNSFEESLRIDQKLYQEMIGCLMYLSTGTRPDISFCLSQLSQYSKDPRDIHLKAVKRIYRYLKGTKDYRLMYQYDVGNLVCSTDAGWCTTKDAKSHSGYTVKIGNALISWRSKKQELVALSTCEAELMSICEGVRELHWISSLLSELEIPFSYPLKLKTDSKAAMDWIKSNQTSARTKHINRKFYFVRDEVAKGNIGLVFVPSVSMEADILTKCLGKPQMEACVNMLGLI